jgi:hypothetical protein
MLPVCSLGSRFAMCNDQKTLRELAERFTALGVKTDDETPPQNCCEYPTGWCS